MFPASSGCHLHLVQRRTSHSRRASSCRGPFPARPVSYRISSGTGVGSTSAGFGPATRSYIESVVVRPCTSMEKSLLSFQETTRNSPDATGHVGVGHRADHARLGVEREHRGLEPDLARGFPLRCAGPAQLLAQPGADDPRGLTLGGRAGEVDARLQVHRTRAAAHVGGVVDVVHRHAVVHEREVLVREVGGQVVERRLGRSQLQAAEQDVALRERLDHAAVLADTDPELPERERVIAEAVHQHFLEPVPQRLLLLERAAERELRLRADADHLGNGVVADRGGVDRRLHVEQCFGGVQLCGRRVRAQAGGRAHGRPC